MVLGRESVRSARKGVSGMWRYLGLGGHFAWLYLVIMHTHVYPFFTIAYERGFVALGFSISLAVALMLFLAWESLAPFMQRSRFVVAIIGIATVAGTGLYVYSYMVAYSPPFMLVAVMLAGAGNGLLTLFWGQLLSEISPAELVRYVCGGLLCSSAVSCLLVHTGSWAMFAMIAFLPTLSAIWRLLAASYTPRAKYPHVDPGRAFLVRHSLGWTVLGACLGFFAVMPESQKQLASHITGVSATVLLVSIALTILLVFAFRAHPENAAICLYRIAIFAVISGIFAFVLGSDVVRFAGLALVIAARLLFLGLSWLVHPRLSISFGKMQVDAVGWITTLFYCGIALGVILLIAATPLIDFDVGAGDLALFVLASMLLALFLFVLTEVDVAAIVSNRNRGFQKSEQQETELVERVAGAYGLSEREIEVVQYLLKGCTIGYVSEKLFIAPSTVKTHVKHIYEKLGIGSRQELRDAFKN